MSSTSKVRVQKIRKDVQITRLDSLELDYFFSDPESIEFIMSKEGETTSSSLGAELELDFSGDVEYLVDISKILEVIYICVYDFEERILPELLELNDDDFYISIKDLYVQCILLNPVLDLMTFNVHRNEFPLADDLRKAVSWLPKAIHRSIQDVIYEDSWADDEIDGFDLDNETVDTYLVSNDDLELDQDSRLDIDLEQVRELKSLLKEGIVGQRYAIDHMCSVAKRIGAGFHDPNRPPAVILFVGPTGVGKTLLAKLATEHLFGKSAFGRIDCATLSEKHDVSKLVGPPPGYVGYPSDKNGDPKDSDPSVLWKETRSMESGGLLLLDEVEKAHPDVWDSFLTIFDEGYAKTSVGNTVDFRNVVIVMTSNLGSYEMAYELNKQPLGFSSMGKSKCEPSSIDEAKQIKVTAMTAAREYMKPELLGRLSSVIPFTNLSKEQMKEIVDMEWDKASKYINEKIDKEIEIEDKLKDRIAEISYGSGTGARMVSRLVDAYIIDPLADLYVNSSQKVEDAKKIKIDYSGKNDSCDIVDIDYGDPEVYKFTVNMGTIDDD